MEQINKFKPLNIRQLKEDINLVLFNHFGVKEMELNNKIFNAVEDYAKKNNIEI